MQETEDRGRAELPSDVNWTKLLTESRKIRKDCEQNEGPSSSLEDFLAHVRCRFPHLRDLLRAYCNLLDGARNYASGEEKKKLIVDTRAALRLALFCSSFEDTKVRNMMVTEAIVQTSWHDPLVYLLSHKKGDAKCRVLASQLLSNLVTSHYDAAKAITASLPVSPSNDVVADRIRAGLSGEESSLTSTVEPTWVDMMLACTQSNNRQALTGIIAALHNAMASLDHPTSNQSNQHITFASNVASNSILVSTLLRQIISMQSVKQAIEKMKHAKDANRMLESEEESLADAATEWISLVLIKCCKVGLLPNLIASAGGVKTDQLVFSEWRIVPEHVVLLQCLRSEMESPLLEKETAILLGGEAGGQSVIETHLFLARLYGSLRQGLPIDILAAQDGQADPEIALKCSTIVTILELLSSSLALDNQALSLTRAKLGETACTLIQDAGRDLGALVDSISVRNAGGKSREFCMSDEEKNAITALVQLVGNVCFQCRQNQDLVRSTSVPVPIQMISSDGTPAEVEERNALHVVLSCTSLAHTCFTLREWAVIAIRNLLDNNELNQAVVAKLEANQPVQSAELGDLGIKVNLDPKGNVTVEPTDKTP